MNTIQQVALLRDLKNKVECTMNELCEARDCVVKFRDSLIYQYKGEEQYFVLKALNTIIQDLTTQSQKYQIIYNQLVNYQYTIFH